MPSGGSSSTTATATATSASTTGGPRRSLLRPLLAWPYLLRAVAAIFLPGHSPRRYWMHARQALLPGRGEGIREAAEAYNRALGRVVAMRILEVTQMWPSQEQPDLGSFLVPLTRELEALGHEVEVSSISQRGGSRSKYCGWCANRAPQRAASGPMSSSPTFSSRRAPRALSRRGPPARRWWSWPTDRTSPTWAGSPESRAATRWVLRRSSAVIANSRWLADRLTERIPAAEPKIEIADCGVDLDAFSPRPAAEARQHWAGTGTGPAFLCVGSLIERKNVVRLADAFARSERDASRSSATGRFDPGSRAAPESRWRAGSRNPRYPNG